MRTDLPDSKPDNRRFEPKNPRTPLGPILPLSVPFTVYVDPCGACNFKCVFCPCNRVEEKAGLRHKVMTWDTFSHVVDGLCFWAEQDRENRRSHRCRVVDLHGFGEPLLNPRFPDMVRLLKEKDVCGELRTVTNASLLTPELGKAIIDAGLDTVQVSVEALSTEGYRRVTGTDTRFEQIVENVRAYYEMSRGTSSRLRVKIISTDLPAEEDRERFFQIFEPIADHVYIHEQQEIWPGFRTGTVPERTGHEAGRPCCSFPFIYMMIHADGEVSPCCQDWCRGLVYGDVNKQTLEEIWHGEALKQLWVSLLDRSAYKERICRDCYVMPYDDIDTDADRIRERLCGMRSCRPM